MILVNESEAYETLYNNKPYTVPQGRFEVTSELGNFLLKQAKHWDKQVFAEDREKSKIEQVIVPEETKKTPLVKEKEDKPQEPKKESGATSSSLPSMNAPVQEKVDSDQVLKEAEDFLKG